jgi:hypothetical protein
MMPTEQMLPAQATLSAALNRVASALRRGSVFE